MTKKATRGRPRKIETPEDFNALVDAYLDKQVAEEKPVTLTGCILAMGIHSRSTLDNYEERPEFSGPVKRLRLIVEAAYEARLHGNNPTGAIFALKNMGWKDTQTKEHTGTVTHEHIDAREHIASGIARAAARLGTDGSIKKPH